MATSTEANAVSGRIGSDDETLSDPGPGERSGISSVVAAELMDDTVTAIDVEQAIEEMPAFGVGDDPAHPIHGSMAGEFEQNAS
ncbi:hypothetical protein HQQ81_12990 [Microbacteriaceae bacterium VKM Ac-2854]|nr:hypothetical protein [Microbacteriaceae bacterium VKM Ac-2854]